MSTKKVLFGIIAGFATGAILGVVLTSKKSATLRKKILAQGEAYLDVVTKKFDNKVADFSRRFEHANRDKVVRDQAPTS